MNEPQAHAYLRLAALVAEHGTDRDRDALETLTPGEVDDPLALLDEAVRTLLEHDGRTVAGWVLAADMQRLDPGVRLDVSPLEHGLDYAISPATSGAHALGIATAVSALLRRFARGTFEGED